MRCPQCRTENTEESKFCRECATPLPKSGEPAVSFTKTLESSPPEPTRGTVFADRYEIIEELGTGGMGRVFRAHDTQLNEEIALKLIKPEFAAEKRIVERFRNEIKIARRITHKNVCRMHDLHEKGKTLFLTMEYVRGEDLKSLIHRTKALTVGSAISYARQVAEGLAEAHKLGIIHRDLKPGNIMIDKEGQAKIMDFGIARVRQEKGVTGEGAIVGTPEYMSPEQVEGKPADAWSDLYALGVILFEMVVGCPPFEGETPFSIANKHKTEPPPVPKKLLPELPEALNGLILRCLEKDRSKRYQTAEELAADLGAMEQALPLTERALTRARTKIRTSREITVKLTPKRMLISVSAIIVLAVAGLFIFRSRDKTGIPPVPSNKPSLAVMYFENRTSEPDLDKLLVEMLTSNLARMDGIEVVSSQRLFDIFSQLKKQDTQAIDKRTASAVASRAAVKAMLLGSIMKVGERLIVNSYLTDVRTGTIIASEPVEGSKIDDLYAMVDQLTARLGGRLGVSSGAASEPIRSADRTTSIAAYQSFQEGLFDYWRFEHAQASVHFQEAVDKDATFASAYLYLALSQARMGYQFTNPLVDMSPIRQNLASARKYADRTTQNERLSIDIWTAISEADFLKARNLSEKMAERFPREKDGYYLLARINVLFDPQPTSIRSAIANLKKLLALNPDDTSAYTMLTYANALAKDNTGTSAAAQKAISLQPDVANPYHSAWETHVTLGLYDEALDYLDEGLKKVRDWPSAYGYKHETFLLMGETERAREALAPVMKWENAAEKGMVLLFEGRHAELVQSLRAEAESYRAQRQADKEWVLRITLGRTLDLHGRYGEALMEYSLAEGLLGTVDPSGFNPRRVITNFWSGVSLARMGDFDGAMARLDASKVLLRSGHYSRIHSDFANLLQAEIYLGQKNWAAAQGALDDTMNSVKLFSPHSRILLAKLAAARGDYPEAIEILKEFSTNIRLSNGVNAGANWLGFFHELSLVDYHLARIYEKSGDKARARAYFRRFLDLKRRPDPGITEVEDARKRLAALDT